MTAPDPREIAGKPQDHGASASRPGSRKPSPSLRRVSALSGFDPSRFVRRWLSRVFSPKLTQAGGYVHIHAPAAVAKSLTLDRCPDCKQSTVFVGHLYEWYGWSETCIRCGRRWSDGEWCELEFSRTARIDNIKSAIELWGRYPDAERIHRVKVKPPRDSDGSPGGEDALAASSETTARAEGIAKPQSGQPS